MFKIRITVDGPFVKCQICEKVTHCIYCTNIYNGSVCTLLIYSKKMTLFIIHSNREGSSQGTNNAGGSLTPSPVLEAISEDAEAPPPPPPPPSPPAPPSFIIPHSSVSPSSSTEESSPTGNSDLPSPG